MIVHKKRSKKFTRKRRADATTKPSKKMKGPTSARLTILQTKDGERICKAIRRETWYQLMSFMKDEAYQRLAASILVAAAIEQTKLSKTYATVESATRDGVRYA